jgi:putative copper resistance protein D
VAAQLLDVFGFLSVLLRGAALAFNSLVLGGVAFLLWVLPSEAGSAAYRRAVSWSAGVLASIQLCYVAADSAILAQTAGLQLRELAGANFFLAGSAGICAAALIAILASRVKSRPGLGLLIPAAITLGALVMTSHAAGRLEYRPALLLLTTLHQGAVASWIGAVPYLLLALKRCGDNSAARSLCLRFSRLALISVAVLVTSGVAMSLPYVGAVAAVYGTTYGAMVASKVALLAMLLCLGGLNFLILRQDPKISVRLLPSLRRFVEAEAGIGFTVILAAASLTSQPPAADLAQGRVSAAEIVQRMSPVWPRLETPPLSSLSPASPLGFDKARQNTPGLLSFVPGTTYHPSTPGDIAWSEYNHHWAGLIVLAAGLLAILARSGIGWARHWPLAFLGLAVFLFLRADPENWPLGPRSFWQSFAVAEVLQHRIFVLLIVAFALFEWSVRTGRITAPLASMVFPAVCAAGGALLLTHTHSLGNIREELLIELSHIPLAIFAVAAGWSRWLELRLAGPQQRVFAWIWPVCFLLIGLVLLNYREA